MLHFWRRYLCRSGSHESRDLTPPPPALPMKECVHCGVQWKDYGRIRYALFYRGFQFTDWSRDAMPARDMAMVKGVVPSKGAEWEIREVGEDEIDEGDHRRARAKYVEYVIDQMRRAAQKLSELSE